MNDTLSQLYQEVILDHAKHPRHFHALEPCTHSATGHNPLCGDNLKVFARLDASGTRIEALSFVGDGCAISKASASLMSDSLQGKTVEEFQNLFQAFHDVVTADAPLSNELGKIKILAGVRDYPVRVKCATLAWHTLAAALRGEDKAQSE